MLEICASFMSMISSFLYIREQRIVISERKKKKAGKRKERKEGDVK